MSIKGLYPSSVPRMKLLHVDTLTVKRELPKYAWHLGSLVYPTSQLVTTVWMVWTIIIAYTVDSPLTDNPKSGTWTYA